MGNARRRLLAALWIWPPNVARSAPYATAERWYFAFRPRAEYDYSCLLEHAQRNYDQLSRGFDALDSKAEALFRLAALVGGLLFTLVQWRQLPLTAALSTAFVCLLLAMLYAAVARMPLIAHAPVKAADMLDHARDHLDANADDDAAQRQVPAMMEGLLAASLDVAAAGLTASCDWKSDKLIVATALMGLGIAALFAGLL